jgi:hypothetical protein
VTSTDEAFVGGHRWPPKVYWRKPDGTDNELHDQHVKELVGVGIEKIARDNMNCGIGVIDFADATVVIISAVIPHGEVFVVNRMEENSILHGGFGDNPFPKKLWTPAPVV